MSEEDNDDIAIQSRRSWDVILVALALVLVLGGIGLLVNWHLAVFALLPLSIALVSIVSSLRPVKGVLTESALVLHRPAQTIAYDDMMGLVVPHRAALETRHSQFPISLVHRGGTVNFPARMTPNSRAIYRMLEACFPHRSAEQLSPELQAFYQEQVELFGADKIWTCQSRMYARAHRSEVETQLPIMLAICGLLWIAVGLSTKSAVGWIPAGAGMLAIAGVAALVVRFGTNLFRGRGLNSPLQGIVVSPGGLGVSQGDLLGALRWEEIISIGPSKRQSFESREPARGLQLNIPGGKFIILDIYNQPLSRIHDKILNYWRPPG